MSGSGCAYAILSACRIKYTWVVILNTSYYIQREARLCHVPYAVERKLDLPLVPDPNNALIRAVLENFPSLLGTSGS